MKQDPKGKEVVKMAKPIKKFKCGVIESAIWENSKEVEGNEIGFKTVSFRRSWKQDGVWRDSTVNLRRNDLQKAILVLQKAQEDLLLEESDIDDKEGE